MIRWLTTTLFVAAAVGGVACTPLDESRRADASAVTPGEAGGPDEVDSLGGGDGGAPGEGTGSPSDTGTPLDTGGPSGAGGLSGTGNPDGGPGAEPTPGGGDSGVKGNEAGATQPVDPCQGIAGCVACTSDATCPEPGACLTKHCNLGKGICEPGFSPEQTACGASKCDGAGQCVGCLGDNDCGDPGVCKVRYCNQSTRVCMPRNAPTTTACGSAGNHCDNNGVCVECSAATECADHTCQTKACNSGKCAYTNVTAGQPGNCTTGVCTATQLCRECVADAQCTRYDGLCTEGKCANNACQSVAKSGPCGTLKMCSGTSCVNSCGNGVTDTQAGEQCDPKALLLNNWVCNQETCQHTGLSASATGSGSSFRRKCTDNTNCSTNEMCVISLQIGAITGQITPICVPKCDAGQCRKIPGYTLYQNNQSMACTDQASCVTGCNDGSTCPPGVSCNSGICGGPFY